MKDLFKICPYFARRILLYFHLMKTLYGCDMGGLNNKKKLYRRFFFGRNGLKKALIERKVILDEKGQVLPFRL